MKYLKVNMVELEPEDYTEILNWFTHKFGKLDLTDKSFPKQATKTFWKLSFLAEARIKELKEEHIDEE